MARVPIYPFLLFAAVCLALIALSQADSKHHKVILHVPYKVHTIHHHTIKKIPIYHYMKLSCLREKITFWTEIAEPIEETVIPERNTMKRMVDSECSHRPIVLLSNIDTIIYFLSMNLQLYLPSCSRVFSSYLPENRTETIFLKQTSRL
ncbi:hypothetical protein GE061_004275 [Apolygus lucorum]|uniref:Uncharacterized protein n=1 Tax=Apolygus lucorum TaxID=248454 RepID=A0A8S9X084_APOLU|nr:hypothetical protein GE061_004275 [Apolygus lucorum]